MEFKTLCASFQELESTTKRNEMIDILAHLFQKSDLEDIDKICYFLVGKITADYEDIQLGMREQMSKSSLSLAFDLDESTVDQIYQEIGDLG